MDRQQLYWLFSGISFTAFFVAGMLSLYWLADCYPFSRYKAYLSYLFRHKYWVFRAGLRLEVSLWRLLIHDWHKLLPSELIPYARTFYTSEGVGRYQPTLEFNYAWNFHQKRAKHHWQYWVVIMDGCSFEPLPMPEKYVREMVADWYGAGKTITGEWKAHIWYEERRYRLQDYLHPETRVLVESLLLSSQFDEYFSPNHKAKNGNNH